MENVKEQYEPETREEATDEQAAEEEPEETKPIFETLKANPNYEISINIYPYIIRRKSNHYVVSVIYEKLTGYERIILDGKKHFLHRIIAEQFIPNPNNFKEVDHINHDKSDNRLQNLRWVSRSTNDKNKTAYKGVKVNYVNELSEDAIEVNEYGNRQLEFYYFDNDKFYYYTGAAYRELHYNTLKSGALFVYATDIDNQRLRIYLNKFKKLYNLI